MSFPAQFRGQCLDCEERFTAGTEIRYSRQHRGVVHNVCPAPVLTAVDLRPWERVCPSCHLVHPGEC